MDEGTESLQKAEAQQRQHRASGYPEGFSQGTTTQELTSSAFPLLLDKPASSAHCHKVTLDAPTSWGRDSTGGHTHVLESSV